MYKTHRYCDKNTKDFIGVGDPYIKKKEVNSRFKSKQFQTNPPKLGQNAGTFDKFPEHKTEIYVDKYKNEQRKFKVMGFGSNDPDRRSEFTVDVVCSQWKEKLKGETKHVDTDLPGADETLDPELSEASFRKEYPEKEWFQTQVPFNTYDLGREGKNGTTPICNKCSRETFYCRHRIKAECSEARSELRRSVNGGLSPTSYNTYGNWSSAEPKEAHYIPVKPKAGRVRTTKQFFDRSHLVGWSG